MRRIWAVAVVVGLLSAMAFFFARRQSDDDQLQAQLARLAAAVHVSEGSNPIVRVAHVRSEFSEIFDEPVHASVADIPATLPTTRRELADTAVGLTSYFRTLDASFSEIEIKIDGSKTIAQVAATARLTATGGSSVRATRPVNLLFYKKDGAWRITSVTVWPKPAS
jgi:hypothetical protein